MTYIELIKQIADEIRRLNLSEDEANKLLNEFEFVDFFGDKLNKLALDLDEGLIIFSDE